MAYKTKQVIQIDVTWAGYKKLALKWLIRQLALQDDLEIERLSIREVKKR